MALDVACYFQVQDNGADTNGGGFVRGGTTAAPTIPTVTASGSGGTVAAGTYYVVVTYTDATGDSVISPERSVTTSGATASFTITAPAAVTYATFWNAYVGTTSGGPYFPQGTALVIGANRVVTTTPPTSGTQPAGVDYTQSTTPTINVADGVANGTTTFTSATANFNGTHVGSVIRVGAALWRRIVGLTNATTIVLDATVSSASSLPVVVGGAFLTPGIVGATLPNGQSCVFLKYSATLYTMSASTNVAGGSISTAQPLSLVGYETTRTPWNTDANRPNIKPSANSVTCWGSTGQQGIISNVIFSNPDTKTSCTVMGNANHWTVRNVKISGFNLVAAGSSNSQDCIFSRCDISVATTWQLGAFSTAIFCDVHDSAGITASEETTIVHCNVYNVTAGSFGINLNGNSSIVANCNVYNVATATGTFNAGISIHQNGLVVNCIVENVNPGSLTGYAFSSQASVSYGWAMGFINCFAYNIKTAVIDPARLVDANMYGITTLSGSPFVAPGSGNFATNNTAGAGALVRAASIPSLYPAGTSTSYLDAGALQAQAAGATPIAGHNFRGGFING